MRALVALRFVMATFAKVFLVAVPVIASLSFGVLLGQCQTLTILHSFAGGTDGQYPYASLVRDSAGNFYGTTGSGGSYQNGTVFKLSPKSGGGWTTSLIYSFKGIPDGAGPAGKLILDKAGNLYGTTTGGGTSAGVCGTYGGCGTVFKLAPATGGKRKETVLHRFTGGTDGIFPYAGLTFSGGNLFGTTFTGGGNGGCFYLGCGVIFEMSATSGRQWKETLAYTFTGGNDGGEPWYGSLISDASGNLYGTTSYTGCDGCSGYYPTVFELSSKGTGWTLATLYTFTDYEFSLGGLALDRAGSIYGTTNSSAYGVGGSPQGSVFQLTNSGGSWSLSTLHSFSGNSDGKYPIAGLTRDAAGNLYGTAEQGGNSTCSVNGYTGCGVVFKMAPASGGSWTFNTLHAFSGPSGDGALPFGGLVTDTDGNLYGTTPFGGAYGYGTVYEVTP